jgi:hypothetical protein
MLFVEQKDFVWGLIASMDLVKGHPRLPGTVAAGS